MGPLRTGEGHPQGGLRRWKEALVAVGDVTSAWAWTSGEFSFLGCVSLGEREEVGGR